MSVSPAQTAQPTTRPLASALSVSTDRSAPVPALSIVSKQYRHNNGRWFTVHQVFSPTARLGIFTSIAAAEKFKAAQSEVAA